MDIPNRLELTDDFAAGWGRQCDERGEVDVFADEANSTITHREVGSTCVERVGRTGSVNAERYGGGHWVTCGTDVLTVRGIDGGRADQA